MPKKYFDKLTPISSLFQAVRHTSRFNAENIVKHKKTMSKKLNE